MDGGAHGESQPCSPPIVCLYHLKVWHIFSHVMGSIGQARYANPLVGIISPRRLAAMVGGSLSVSHSGSFLLSTNVEDVNNSPLNVHTHVRC